MTLAAPEPERLARRVPLAPFTSLKVGGPADFFLQPRTRPELAQARRWAHQHGLPVQYLGSGSNLLIADAGVEGLVIRCAGELGQRWSVRPDGRGVDVQAGVTLASLARRLSKAGCGGMEWASNVPGTVGGAVVNNAGAFGSEMAQHLVAVTILDAEDGERRVTTAELEYAYRSSVLKRHGWHDVAVMSAEVRVEPTPPEVSQRLIAQYQRERTRAQPRQLSAGSVFANPAGDYAGRLIEVAGLKGTRHGGACVSPLHGNFIVNEGAATATEVLSLMRRVQRDVLATSGVALRPEIELLGRWEAEEPAWPAGCRKPEQP